MRHSRVIAALLAVAGLATGGSPAFADGGAAPGNDGQPLGPAPVITLPPEGVGLSQGNPEGVAFDRRTGMVFVSRTATGAIQAGVFAGPSTALDRFAAGGSPRADSRPQAAGLKVREGRLYVAGGASGLVTVYDIATRSLLATFNVGPAVVPPALPFVNDLVVTEDGDVYATDSFRPYIYRIDGRAVAAGGGDGAVQAIPVGDKVEYVPGQFNLNGIVEDDGDLIVVQSNKGKLFRVTPADDAPLAEEITEIVVRGGPLTRGDGLLLDRGRLLVVQGGTTDFPNGVVTVVKLRESRARGAVERRIADASLAGPSTIARARDNYLVVNANFENPSPYTVSLLPRGRGADDD
jgi:hypothetical protein